MLTRNPVSTILKPLRGKWIHDLFGFTILKPLRGNKLAHRAYRIVETQNNAIPVTA